MNFIIVFLLPSVLGLKIFMNLNKDKKIFDLIIYYLLLVLFSNFISMIVVSLFNKDINNIVYFAENNLNFSISYIINTIIFNILLSNIFTIIIKYINFDIEVENGKKNKKKKNKKNS